MRLSLYRSSEFPQQKKRKEPKIFSYLIAVSVLKTDISELEKLFYGFLKRITKNRDGCCFWTNTQLAEQFQASERSVSRWLSDFRDRGWIETDYFTENKISIRRIRLPEGSTTDRYVAVPAVIAHSKLLTDGAKLAYGVIANLTRKTGECWATNAYIGEQLGACGVSVITWVRDLEKIGLIEVDRGLNDRRIWLCDLKPFIEKNVRCTDPKPPTPPSRPRKKGGAGTATPTPNTHLYIQKNKKNNSARERESHNVVSFCENSSKTPNPKPPSREILPCLQMLPAEYRLTDAAKRWISYRFSPNCVERGVRYLLLRNPEFIKNSCAYLVNAILKNYTPSNPLVRKIELLTTLITLVAPKSIAEKISQLPRGVILAYSSKFGWEQRSKTAITNDECNEYISTICNHCRGKIVTTGNSISVYGPNGELVASA